MKELTPDEHKILVDAIQDSATVVHKGRKDMNERIRQLAEQATTYIEPTYSSGEGWIFDKEKFAELIVRECAQVCQDQPNHYALKTDRDNCAVAIKEHFGVES